MVEEHGINETAIEPEVGGSPDGIAGIFDRDAVRWIILAIQETGQPENAVAVGASGIAAEGDGEQLEGAFLRSEVEAFDSPKYLILSGGCGENDARSRHGIGDAEHGESCISVRVDIYIKMANRCDAFLSAFTAAEEQRISSNVDVRAISILVRK